MLISIKTAITTLLFITALAATGAQAAGKPKGAKKLAPEAIIAQYSNRTITHNSDDGAYAKHFYNADGTFRAVEYTGKVNGGTGVGAGRWFVTRTGRMCHEGRWKYLRKDGTSRDYTNFKFCINHLRDPNGIVWFKPGDEPRWTPNKISEEAKYAKGYTFRSQFNAAHKKVGY